MYGLPSPVVISMTNCVTEIPESHSAAAGMADNTELVCMIIYKMYQRREMVTHATFSPNTGVNIRVSS